jgi:hypothetical protein
VFNPAGVFVMVWLSAAFQAAKWARDRCRAPAEFPDTQIRRLLRRVILDAESAAERVFEEREKGGCRE